jgi:hypothetical protein
VEIAGLGLNLKGNLLFPPQDEVSVSDSLVGALERNAQAVNALTSATAKSAQSREAIRQTLDPGDPAVAGWTFLLNGDDANKDQITEILRPLAIERGMTDPDQPLLYRDVACDRWFEWKTSEYDSLELQYGKTPQYVLLVGNPQQIPFGLQTLLATSANVGRLDFDTLEQLQIYVDKVRRLEKAKAPVVEREAVFFAPDGGPRDPTRFSRQYMAIPMAEHVRTECGLATQEILGDEATREALEKALLGRRPALVYTASHGLGATEDKPAIQKQCNGAICCQHDGPPSADSLFGAENVSHKEPFLEGSIFFQFACFGYGTPARSEFADWIKNVPARYTDADFTAALPKKLLSHPRGPIAYIGHLDLALLHGFTDVRAPDIDERWHKRIQPFVSAVTQLLNLQPSGFAMEKMSSRLNTVNATLTADYDRQRRAQLQWTPEKKASLLDRWLIRGDARNYMVMGDPAARLRLPDRAARS